MLTTEPNITLEDLVRLEGLSVRSINICKAENLLTINDIIGYYKRYKEYGGFTNVKNCGKKSNKELSELCNKYINDNHLTSQNELVKAIDLGTKKKTFYDLTDRQLTYLNQLFIQKLDKLADRRAINILKNIFSRCNNSFLEYYSFFSKRSFLYTKIKGVGKSTVTHIESFTNELLTIANNLLNENENEKINLHVYFLKMKVQKEFSKVDWEKTFFSTFFEQHQYNFLQKRFPLFDFLNFIIEEKMILSDRGLLILKSRYGYYSNVALVSLEDLGEKMGITRERVRQLAKPEKLLTTFWGKIRKIITIFGVDRMEIDIDLSNNLIILDKDDCKCSFTKFFIYKVLAICLDDKFELILNYESHTYKHKYLINKKVLNVFNFRKLIYDTKKLCESKIEKDCELNLRGYIYPYFKEKKAATKYDILYMCEQLLYEEFGILTTIRGTIIIERNIVKKIHEYIMDILTEFDHPMHVKDIYTQLLEKYPEKAKSVEAVRGAIQNNSAQFIYTEGSTYGLKIWEEQGRYLGGSIKDLVEKYLTQFDKPKHIYEVSKFVIKHRNTNENSVYRNLQIDPHERFILFTGGFVGITSKNYLPKDILFKKMYGSIAGNIKRRYFFNSRSILPYKEIVNDISLKKNYKPIQIIAIIERNIEKGEFFLGSDGYLHIVKQK